MARPKRTKKDAAPSDLSWSAQTELVGLVFELAPRATEIAETWATILARRELGESLIAIATDMEMRYETVKTYAKLAQQALTLFHKG